MLYLTAFFVITACFLGFGVGVIFFGKAAHREACGTVPEAKNEDCPSGKAGLCPTKDTTGLVAMAKRGAISYFNKEAS